MTAMTQDQLVADLARDVVMQVAPHELPLFPATSQAYFEDPDKVLKRQTGRDEMLGFGTGEAVQILTPFILSILSEIVKHLSNEFAASVKTEGATYVNERVKQIFQKFRQQTDKEPEKQAAPESAPEEPQIATGVSSAQVPAAADPTALTKEQLAQVYEIARKKAKALKLPESKATLLAEAVVGTLAMA